MVQLANGDLVNYLDKRIAAMTLERQSFIPHYRDLAQYIQPRKGRFLVTDRNKGSSTGTIGDRHKDIINSKGTTSLRRATAGMLAGTMSPTRPWFSMRTINPELMEVQNVKVWLKIVEGIIRDIFNASNLYQMAPTYIGELLLFGTATMSHVDDFADVARFYTHTAGSYVIAQDERHLIRSFGREYQTSVNALVKQFGIENVSTGTRDHYSKGDYETWVDVRHFIELNPDADARNALSSKKPFRQVYWEPGANKDKVLQVSGFNEYPLYTTRWELAGEDIYSTDCPAMTAMGDVKGLQIQEKRRMQGIEKQVNPPLRGPANLRSVPISGLPGGVTLYDGDGTAKLEPIYTVTPQLAEMSADIERTERRIEEAFYVDMFLAISQMDGIQPRNELDLNHRDQERLLQLGPVLERMHGEFLSPLIDRTFAQGLRADIFPPPPQELEKQVLRIKFISSLARAQRAVATRGIEQVAGFVTGLAGGGFEQALDKFDADQAIDDYSEAVGVDPRLIVSDDAVATVRERRAAIQQQQQMLEMAAAGADTAKTLADTDTTKPSGLTEARDAMRRGAEGGS